MTDVLHLVRDLDARPDAVAPQGIELRNYAGPDDIDRWLDIRHQAFARQSVGVRQWTGADFEQEFLAKPWWRADRLWFAEAVGWPLPTRQAVGTITLAMRGTGADAAPVIHWLAVLPRFRRTGVARYLLAVLEGRVWDEGHRRVMLETHRGWTGAVLFYESQGYRPVQTGLAEPAE